jgi:hypothetical protein
LRKIPLFLQDTINYSSPLLQSEVEGSEQRLGSGGTRDWNLPVGTIADGVLDKQIHADADGLLEGKILHDSDLG